MFGMLQFKRSATDRYFAGVCGGMAKSMGMDSSAMRGLWVIGALIFSPAIPFVYIVLGLVLPLDQDEDDNIVDAG